MYLEKINGPEDVKKLSMEQLNVLAGEMREALFHRLTKTGGHFGPNFGVVEMTIAMHYVFDSPKDKFVFDVSHQTYPHKMLTGRAPPDRTGRTRPSRGPYGRCGRNPVHSPKAQDRRTGWRGCPRYLPPAGQRQAPCAPPQKRTGRRAPPEEWKTRRMPRRPKGPAGPEHHWMMARASTSTSLGCLELQSTCPTRRTLSCGVTVRCPKVSCSISTTTRPLSSSKR